MDEADIGKACLIAAQSDRSDTGPTRSELSSSAPPHAHACTCMRIHMHTCACTWTWTFMHAHAHACMRMRMHMHACAYSQAEYQGAFMSEGLHFAFGFDKSDRRTGGLLGKSRRKESRGAETRRTGERSTRWTGELDFKEQHAHAKWPT